MKLLKKTLMATAIAAAATTATAADLDFSGGDGTIVLANIIFGEGSPGTGSEETLITAPETTFDLVDVANNNNGDSGLNAQVATIKYTLGGGAIFGEDLSTTTAVDAANGGAGAFSLVAGVGAVTYEVVQGGAIGDNTITFELTFVNDGDELNSITFTGYDVKNLTSALRPSSANPRVELGVEYVESGPAVDGDDIVATATDTPLTIFASQEPLNLTANAVDFGIVPFTRINVGNGELTFTGGTADGRSDFDPAADTTRVNLGTLQLALEAISVANVNLGANPGIVKKENGDDFDFQGGDTHALSITAASGSFQAGVGSTMFLTTDPTCAAEVHPGLVVPVNTLTASGLTTTVTGTTTALTASYNLCYSVNGTASIPEVAEITAAWDVDFFNTRYDNRSLTAGTYGPLRRNGCIASFFNIPTSSNPNDTAYVRLTNTSTTNSGDIRGTLYAQDGTILGADVTVAPSLATHATQVFSTEGADRTSVATGQTVLDIETAFGITDPADYKGRARLVLKGAFDTCEGLGLIRSSATGALYNMTSTTQGNEAAAPNDGNNAN